MHYFYHTSFCPFRQPRQSDSRLPETLIFAQRPIACGACGLGVAQDRELAAKQMEVEMGFEQWESLVLVFCTLLIS